MALLIDNVSKTKGMAFGDGLSAADIAPLQTDSEEIEMVNNHLPWLSDVF